MTIDGADPLPSISFPDWVPALAPAPESVRRLGRVEVVSGLSRWSVSADWMERNGDRPIHEMVLDLAQFTR